MTHRLGVYQPRPGWRPRPRPPMRLAGRSRPPTGAGQGSGGITVHDNSSTKHNVSVAQSLASEGNVSTQEFLNKALAELEILGELQAEKQQSLERARLRNKQLSDSLKQKSVQLDEVLYQNAQKTQSLSRIKKRVEEAARSLHTVNQRSSYSSKGIEELNRKLEHLNQIHKALSFYEKKLELKNSVIKRLMDGIEAKYKRFEESTSAITGELLQNQKTFSELEAAVAAESKTLQTVDTQVSQIATTNESIVRDIESKKEYIESTVCEIAIVEDDIKKKSASHGELLQSIKENLSQVTMQHEKQRETMTEVSGNLNRTKRLIDVEWDKVLKLCRERGISPTKQEEASTTTPESLLSTLKQELQDEEKAIADEARNKQKLENELTEAQAQQKSTSLETIAAVKKAEDAMKALEATKSAYKSRRDEALRGRQEYQELEKKVNDLSEEYSSLKAESKVQIDELSRECKRAEIRQKQILFDIEEAQQASDMATIEVEEAKRTHEEASWSMDYNHKKKLGDLDETTQNIKKAEADLEAVTKSRKTVQTPTHSLKDEYKRVYGTHHVVVPGNEIGNAEDCIEQMIRDFPELEFIEISYDATKTAEEQAEEILSDLFDECDRRIESASKLNAELKEKSKREKEERERINTAAKEEIRRKELLRRKRSKTSGNDDNSTVRELINQLDKAANSPRDRSAQLSGAKKVHWNDRGMTSELRPRSLNYNQSKVESKTHAHRQSTYLIPEKDNASNGQNKFIVERKLSDDSHRRKSGTAESTHRDKTTEKYSSHRTSGKRIDSSASQKKKHEKAFSRTSSSTKQHDRTSKSSHRKEKASSKSSKRKHAENGKPKSSTGSQAAGVATTETKIHRKRTKLSSKNGTANNGKSAAAFGDDFGFSFK